jgi:hypothetical protein
MGRTGYQAIRRAGNQEIEDKKTLRRGDAVKGKK